MTVSMQSVSSRPVYGWALTVREGEIEFWRRAVAAVFERWGAPPHSVEVARLGVSELLTNVAEHVEAQRCYLRAVRVGQEAVVQVYDRSLVMPVIREPDWESEAGRGLWLLREMADRLGYEVTRRRSGKIVWFSCALRHGGGRVPRCGQ